MIALTESELLLTPVGFVEGTLGLPYEGGQIYDWQHKALAELEFAGYGNPLVEITCLAPNEGGKSSVIVGGASCYWLDVFRGKVGITTKDTRQLNEQIIPAIEKQIHKFTGWKSVRSPYYKVTTPAGGVLIAFCTADEARVEGLHGTETSPLLWIVDEAKSVGEHIFAGIDRCGYQALIYVSSGGVKQGTFFDSHYGKGSDRFIKVRAGLVDCPHIAPEKVKRIVEKYGEDHPFTRSSVYGEFMEQSDSDDYAINHQALADCLLNPPKHKPGLRTVGFVDFGAGVAEHTFAKRDGNKVTLEACWIESNKNATVGRFIREFIKAGFTQKTCSEVLWCDASDKELWTLLAGAGWQLRRQNFGAPARLEKEYRSWAAEAWIEAGIKIAKCEVILDDDDTLKAQLLTRKKGISGQGKLYIEDKFEMQKRNLPSPDRADAVVGVLAIPDLVVHKEIFNRSRFQDSQRNEVLEAMGAGSAGY